ncbi:hypothetical protein TNCT_204401 [Trichonephila clavata]|uniref:Uncharacterized protein n=1 Tax=Trichonephila clavata TaxID=2740835 RepID=A0A8X6LS92_TRICU|nr:hypothetical protein TNCT_204401 [Trichonephila clavata]
MSSNKNSLRRQVRVIMTLISHRMREVRMDWRVKITPAVGGSNGFQLCAPSVSITEGIRGALLFRREMHWNGALADVVMACFILSLFFGKTVDHMSGKEEKLCLRKLFASL